MAEPAVEPRTAPGPCLGPDCDHVSHRRELAAVHNPACYICNAMADEAELVLIFGRPMCRDRVDCYTRYKGDRRRRRPETER